MKFQSFEMDFKLQTNAPLSRVIANKQQKLEVHLKGKHIHYKWP